MGTVEIREVVVADHARILEVMVDWWGGRDLRSSIPKILLIHFRNTSFVAEDDGRLTGFLIGFFSQTEPDTGFIHFAGVHPDYRSQGVGRELYRRFYDCCQADGRATVKSCTAPINRNSIKFHQALGFVVEKGEATIDGVEVSTTFMGVEDPLVLFTKKLG